MPAPTACAADDAAGAEPDAEVSFVTRDLAGCCRRPRSPALPIDDVLARVRDAANWTGGASRTAACRRPAARRWPKPPRALRSLCRLRDAHRAGEHHAAAEDRRQTTGGNAWNERVVTVKKGESIATDPARARRHARRDQGDRGGARRARPRRRLKEGQKLRILLAAADDGKRLQPVRVIVIGDSAIEAVVALSDKGKYVSVDVSGMNTEPEVADAGDDDEDDGKGVRLYQSIYETALRNQVPRR